MGSSEKTVSVVYSYFKLSGHAYLGPLRIELAGFHGIIKRRLVLSQFEKRRWTVAVQDAVLRVGLQGVGVQMDGRLEVATLARLVALLHFLHELCFAETTPAPSVSWDAARRSARRPGAEDWKLGSQTQEWESNAKCTVGSKIHNYHRPCIDEGFDIWLQQNYFV